MGAVFGKYFLLSLLLLCAYPVSASASLSMQLFGSHESESDNLAPFTKWTTMLQREASHRRKMKKSCRDDQCLYRQWQHIIDQAKTLSPLQKLIFVNREINRVPYIVDPQNWQMDDYWETPYEFFVYSGDCEDFAITKYLTLKQSGISPDQMRIVVLQDNNLNLLHSVLAVRIEDETYILDNQFSQVMTDRAIHHYQPIYSINEHHWWRHLLP
jgi:predicted transglutaminase-like cysteine proteinase